MKNNIKNATFARYDGLAVVIIRYAVCGGNRSMVRYCGPEGKKINPRMFTVKNKELTEY